MKKIFKVLATQKRSFCAIALVAVIGFSFTTCDDDTGGGGTGGGTPVPVTGVSLNKTSLSLAVGGSATLTATVAPSNATNKNVTWTSSDPTKATVTNGGVVRAVATGSTTITVKTADGNKTATCAVTVTGGGSTIAVTGVTLNKSSLSLAVGGSETLTATVAPNNATNKNVTWTSSAPTIATVTNGLVRAVSAGSTTIIVSTVDGGKTATCSVTVTGGGVGGETTTSPTGIVLVSIPAGTFMMGSPTSEPNRYSDETQHSVTLSRFKMGKYQVTQEQYRAVMGSNPSNFKSAVTGESGTPGKLPVEKVSWYDALVFCNKLSIKEGLTPAYSISSKTNPTDWGTVPTSSDATWNAVVIVAGSTGYRLPTEAQWEYACRAGTTTAYNTGASISDNTGWYDKNSGSKTHQVGLKSANAWGLYDMHGNVTEWCWDRYGSYSSGSQTDPTGAVTGSLRVRRGGSWYNIYVEVLRSAFRVYDSPIARNDYVGFRLVRP